MHLGGTQFDFGFTACIQTSQLHPLTGTTVCVFLLIELYLLTGATVCVHLTPQFQVAEPSADPSADI